MKIEVDMEYYRRREREERVAATASPCEAVHDAHFVLAERYADRIYSLGEQMHDDQARSRVVRSVRQINTIAS